MKWFCIFFAALLLLAGCSASSDPQALAALEDVMAAAAVSNDQEITLTAADGLQWDGLFVSGDNSVSLTLDQDGSLRFSFSADGASGSASVSGSSAKSDELYFSLSGDILSVFGGSYTGNYERQ